MVKQILERELPLWKAIIALVAFLFGALFFIDFISAKTGVVLPTPSFRLVENGLRYGEWPELSNGDFFAEVRTAFLAQKKDFVEANLTEMKLRVYRGGALAKEVPILTKGREGSWWETPAGLYKAETKAKDHFSSVAGVHLPWSIPFQGNFFIHGWPYYANGEPVTSRYSGGCIRLSTEDAKTIYDLISVGEPILVFNERFTQDSFTYEPRRPEISAESYLAADLKNDYVFLSKESQREVSVASLTKLMTALVASEYINLDFVSTISPGVLASTSKARLAPEQEISAYDLLFPLLLESSNEAANAYADILGPSRFVRLMNEKARSLGMNTSTFVEPSGAYSGNISTAEDLFNLAKYLYHNRRFLLSVTAGDVHDSAYGIPLFRDLDNYNVFEEDGQFVGGKTGISTAAGQTIISIFHLTLNGAERPVVFIALGSQDIKKDIEMMRAYVEQNY